MILNLTLDQVTRHTVVYHSSTSTYTSNFVQIKKKLFVDGRTDIKTGRVGEVDIKMFVCLCVFPWDTMYRQISLYSARSRNAGEYWNIAPYATHSLSSNLTLQTHSHLRRVDGVFLPAYVTSSIERRYQPRSAWVQHACMRHLTFTITTTSASSPAVCVLVCLSVYNVCVRQGQ